MKSRLNFVKALVHDPKLLFLDEPTGGLDPANSRRMKDLILAGGQILALDSPHNLIMSKGAAKVTYTWLDHGEHTASCPLDRLSEDPVLRKLIAENALQSIHSSEPDLNDLFMEITGRALI